jgi:hypothetical protein
MGITDGIKNIEWRKLAVPGAASLVGAGAGLVLTRTRSLRSALPKLDDVGMGDLVDDLRTKVSSVVGSGDSGNSERQTSNSPSTPLSTSELEARRRRREERRQQRAGR